MSTRDASSRSERTPNFAKTPFAFAVVSDGSASTVFLLFGQTAASRLRVPLLGVVVAFEEDLLLSLTIAERIVREAVEVARLELLQVVGELGASESATAVLSTVCGQ